MLGFGVVVVVFFLLHTSEPSVQRQYIYNATPSMIYILWLVINCEFIHLLFQNNCPMHVPEYTCFLMLLNIFIRSRSQHRWWWGKRVLGKRLCLKQKRNQVTSIFKSPVLIIPGQIRDIINRMQPEAANKGPQTKPEQPFEPMLLKVSLRKHTPQEIYEFVQNRVGNLGMKIKKRQAIIGFENPKFYQQLLDNHTFVLHGRKIQFKAIPMGDEHNLCSQEQEVEEFKYKEGTLCPFRPIHDVEGIINASRYTMVKNIQTKFKSSIEVTRKRMQQLRLQFREDALRNREFFCLGTAIEKRLHDIQARYVHDIGKLQRYIEEFYAKPINIDLEPSFTFEETWQFPKLTLNNLKFSPASYFPNKNNYPCKRLCAINGEEFAVTMAHPKYTSESSYVKIYDLKIPDPKKSIKFDRGTYAISRVNNFLLVGTYDSNTLKYVNLEDEQLLIESSQQLCEFTIPPNFQKCFFYEIKPCKFSAIASKILTLSTDCTIRHFQLSFVEAIPGVMTVSFEQKLNINAEDCLTIQALNEETFLYGGRKFVRLYNMTKKKSEQITISEKAVKIKKFGQNLFCIANTKAVEMVDLRTNTVVQTFPLMHELRTIEVLGEHTVMYGAAQEIGVLDDRLNDLIHWKAEGYHKGTVYDILKLKNKVVSCDSNGDIYSWEQAELGSAVVARPYNPLASSVQIEFGRK